MLSPRLQTLLRSSTQLPGRLRELAKGRAPWLWLFLFALLVSFAYTTPTPPRAAPAVPEAHGDGLYYYAYLRSLAFDRDLDFSNDYALLGDQFHAGVNPITRRPQNVFTVGPALFWLPLVPVAELAQDLSEWFGAPHEELDGTEPSFQRIVLFGSTLAGLVATALALALALRITEPSFAILASIGLCVGSPLIWFMLRQPSFSHATDACAVALFASAWLARFGSRSLLQWVGMGLLLGLAMLVRPQNIAHVMLPLAEWLWLAVPLIRARDARALSKWVATGGAFVLAAALAFSPLLWIWRSLYGRWTLVPQGADFMHWYDSRWDVTLFSSRGGLFAWHPLILLSVVGLFVLACSRRYARELRLFAVLGIVILLAQSYINGAARDWWGGWAFGGRRFLSCTIYFAAGLATMLETFRRFVVARPARFAKLSAAAFVCMFALYNRSLADDYLFSRVAPDAAQPMKPRYASALLKTLDEGYALFGNPGSWPANLWFAFRARTSPERYDTAAAHDLVEHPAGALAFFVEEEFPMGGFDPEPSEWAGRRCRIAREPRATWVFALRRQIELRALISVAASEPHTRVRMRIGGHVVLDREITTSYADYTFDVPLAETHSGLFYVEVEQTLPRPGAFVAWEKAFFTFHNPPPED
ncbi:MAG: hypothetical protein JWN04_4032 [Myxococcaceae bacterium]|nr:hypothetical protein [Myxococcaceae bacterium]